MQKRTFENLVDLLILLLITVFLLSYFRPGYILSDTIISGGDNPSHYFAAYYLKKYLLPRFTIFGWMHGNYAGLPLFQFYFPLTFLVSALLGYIIPLAVSFKLVTLSGTFLLPVSIYLFVRLLRFPFPAPALGAISSLAFLFIESNSMWGGNIPSTLSGEFAHSLSLSLMMVCLGLIYNGISEQKHTIKSTILVSVIGLTHACPLIFMTLSYVFFFFDKEDFIKNLAYILKINITAFCLLGFWIIPFLCYLRYTTPFTFNWVFGSVKELIPPILIPFFILAVSGSVLMGIQSLRKKRQDLKQLTFLWFCVFLGGFLYFIAPALGIVDIRFLPFSHLFLTIIGAVGFYSFCRYIRGRLLVPLFMFSGVVVLVTNLTTYIPDRIRFNYTGFEDKPLWNTFSRVNSYLSGTASDPRVVYEHSHQYRSAGGIRAFELLPLFSGRNTLEGLYLQSSLSSPFVFYIQSEISEIASWPLQDYNYSRLNLKRGIEHLKMFNVKDFVVVSEKVRSEIKSHSQLRLKKRFSPYSIYEIAGNNNRYVVPLENEPVLVVGGDWRKLSYNWFRLTGLDVHLVFKKDLEGRDKQRFGNILFEDIKEPPKTKLPETDINKIEEVVNGEEILIKTPYLNHPHLIKISYHPNWKVEGADAVYLVSPSFMLVYPKSNNVRLYYGSSLPEYFGRTLSLLGIIFIAMMVFCKPKTRFTFLEKYNNLLHKGLLVLVVSFGVFALMFCTHSNVYKEYNKGLEYFNKKKYEQAKAIFSSVMKQFPYSPVIDDAISQYAYCFFREENWQQTIETFNFLLENYPETRRAAEAHYHIGMCYRNLGDNGSALRAYETVTSEFPDTVWAGYAGDGIGQLKKASLQNDKN